MKQKLLNLIRLRMAMLIGFVACFAVTALGQTTVTQTSFSAVNGNVDSDTHVTYAAYKGGGTSNPAINSNAIRLYQNASGATAGYLVIGVGDGYEITSATIRSTMATTTGYYLSDTDPGSNTPAKSSFAVSNYSLSANADYTVSGINTQYITFACFGTSSSSRLYVSKISVTYVQTGGGETYTVTLSDDTDNPMTEYSYGVGVTLPSRTGVGSYSFLGWSETNVPVETTTAPTIIPAGSYYPTEDITLYPVYTRTETSGGASSQTASVTMSEYATAHSWGNSTSAGQKTVTLDANVTATCNDGTNSGKMYSEWRIYQSEGGKVTIATSVGELNSVTFTYSNSNNGILKYGDTTLTSGTAVSVSGSSAEFDVANSGSATNGQIRITAISVDYTAASSTTYYISTPSGEEKVETPTITIASGPFVSTKAITITCGTSGAAIQYSTDGGSTWTNYSASFNISATTTVKAKATKSGMSDSDIATETFTKETVLDGISALAAQTNTADATYYVNLTNAQVTWASGSIGYMEDSNAGMYLYNVTPTQDLVYNGIFSVTYQVYNSMPEVKSITAVEGTTSAGSAKAPTVMTASALDAAFDANLGRQIKIEAFTVPSSKELTTNIALYESSPYTSVSDGVTYDLVGYPFYTKVSGTLTKQFRITSTVEKVLEENEITGINDVYTIDLANGDDELDLTGASATSGATVQFAVTSSTVAAGDYDLTSGVLTVVSNGIITIRAYVDADANYNGAEKIVTVKVIDDPVIAYSGASETVVYGTNYTVDESLIEGGAVSLSSSNSAIASVSDLVVTPVAVGTATITVNTAATDIWHAGTATFTLTITAPEGKTTAATGSSTIFEEHFSGCESTGGNDGNWSGSIATGTLSDASTDETGWSFTRGNAGDGCAKFGTSSAQGIATTRALGQAGTLTLTFKAGAWNGNSEATTLNLSVTAGELDTESVTLVKGEFTEYTVTITNATEETSITFAAAATKNNRFFLDDVVVTTEGTEAITCTLNSAGYATYCSVYPLDFSDAEADGYSAWQITDIDIDNNITFEKITGSVKGGTGLFFMGTPSETITLTSENSTNVLDRNMLIGTTAPTYFAAGEIYGLSGSTFKKNNAGAIRANKAYLESGWLDPSGGSETKAFTFVFVDNTTGITETRTVSAGQAAEIFNIAGQRLSTPQKGINIIGCKKVLVK